MEGENLSFVRVEGPLATFHRMNKQGALDQRKRTTARPSAKREYGVLPAPFSCNSQRCPVLELMIYIRWYADKGRAGTTHRRSRWSGMFKVKRAGKKGSVVPSFFHRVFSFPTEEAGRPRVFLHLRG